MARSWCGTALAIGIAVAPSSASAHGDGVYGRLSGELDWSLKLGAASHPAGFSPSAGASLHYYSLFGVTADVGPMAAESTAEARTGAALGAELRPLFLPRWLLGWQQGSAFWDLVVDSLSVGLGSYTSLTHVHRSAVGLWLSAGAGVPLTARSDGPWLEVRALRRIPDPAAHAAPPHGSFLVYLSYHDFATLLSSPERE